jgi:hypothetical protein
MIEIRKDVEIFLASKRKTHETKMMQERLNHLEIITFKEYKNSLIYFRRILFERYKYV